MNAVFYARQFAVRGEGRMLRPSASTIIFGALVIFAFAVLVTLLLPLSGPAWSTGGAEGLYYSYLSEFF